MPASTFTAIASFKMVLPGKNPITLLGKVKIPIFNWNDFAHVSPLRTYFSNRSIKLRDLC